MRISALVALATILTLAGCGGDDGTGTSSSISFRGTFAGTGDSGVIDVTAASPITGTLTITGGPVINVTGDYDAATGAFTASGGGYSFTGTFADGTLNGTFTGPNGSGLLTALPSNQMTVRVFCGSGGGSSPGGSVSFTWNMVLSGNTLVGLSVETASSAAPGEQTRLTGILSGNAILLVVIEGSATGTLSGEMMSGTWASDEGGSGTWMGSTAACG